MQVVVQAADKKKTDIISQDKKAGKYSDFTAINIASLDLRLIGMNEPLAFVVICLLLISSHICASKYIEILQ